MLIVARQTRWVEVKDGALPAMSDLAAAYDRQASKFAELYDSLSFEDCHGDMLDLVPERPGLVLDVGAGSGRDAGWFAGSGWDVVAVEPAEGMRREGQQRHPEAPIRWLSDRLPGLEAVHRLGLMFDLVWLSAVWMHVIPAERQRAFRKLATLLKPGGRLVLTLRHGPVPADRPMHEATAAELERLRQATRPPEPRCRPLLPVGSMAMRRPVESVAVVTAGEPAPEA